MAKNKYTIKKREANILKVLKNIILRKKEKIHITEFM